MEGMEGAGGAVAGQALNLDLDQPEPADVEACYAAELGAVQIGDWNSTAPGAYNRCGFASTASICASVNGANQTELAHHTWLVFRFGGY